MKVKVRLFGPLSRTYPGYDSHRGLDVDLSSGARVGDLLSLLRLGEGEKPVVAVNRVLRDPKYELFEGAEVHVLQAVYGG